MSYVGTSNEYEALPDDLTGNRRFIPILLDWEKDDQRSNKQIMDYAYQDMINKIKDDRDQLLAEATHYDYKNGHNPRLPPNLWETNRQAHRTT